MATLQDLEGPIDAEVTTLLVAATPDWWKEAQLEVTRHNHPDGVVGLAHTISSPEGHKEIVSPTDELLDATYRLATLFETHGKTWKRVVYTIKQAPDGSWAYRVSFSY